MCLITLFQLKKEKEKNKILSNIIDSILNEFDNKKLIQIMKYCKEYITYTIDTKQINNINGVKTRQKEYAILLEHIESKALLNNFKIEQIANNSANNIKSTFDGKITESTTDSNKNENAVDATQQEKPPKSKKKGG